MSIGASLDPCNKENEGWAIFMGDFPLMRDALSRKMRGKRHWILWNVVGGIDAVVRGFGQVVFANNPVSGLLIVITLGITSPSVLLFGSITGIIGLLISYLILDAESSIENGLTVYNPLLIGIVTSALLPHECGEWDGLTILLMFMGTLFSVLLTRAQSRRNLPVITMPFNIAEVIILIALKIQSLENLPADPMQLPNLECKTNDTSITGSMMNTDIRSICRSDHSNSTETIDWGMVFRGVVTSSAQVFAIDNVIAGSVIYLAVLIYSPTTALLSLIGAATGTLGAMGLGAPQESIYSGLWGYNSLLLSSALGGIFIVLNTQTSLLALIASAFTVLLQYTLNFFFSKMDLSVLSIPFVITCYLFISIRDVRDPLFLEPMTITFPERQMEDFKRISGSFEENLESPVDV